MFPEPDFSRTLIDVCELRRWLESKGIKDGFFFPDSTNAPDYLDQNHPRYSAKLAASIKVWQAMDDENLIRGKAVMDAMKGWLESRHKELGLVWSGNINKTGIEEVAKVANWQTAGGAPKTPIG